MPRRLALLALFGCGLLFGSPSARGQADPQPAAELPPITFSKLVVRVDGDDEIAIAPDDYRVLILETMRSEGLNALGAENLVFARDDSSNADFVLGGTLRELSCRRDGVRPACCRVGVEWELFDVASDDVVYRVLSRYGDCNLEGLDGKGIARQLIVTSLRKTLLREPFKAALGVRKPVGSAAGYDGDGARFERCRTGAIAMGTQAERVLDATVLVTSGMCRSGTRANRSHWS